MVGNSPSLLLMAATVISEGVGRHQAQSVVSDGAVRSPLPGTRLRASAQRALLTLQNWRIACRRCHRLDAVRRGKRRKIELREQC